VPCNRVTAFSTLASGKLNITFASTPPKAMSLETLVKMFRLDGIDITVTYFALFDVLGFSDLFVLGT